jgi:hypothetical protein
MLTNQNTQLWTLSADSSEYERSKNLLSGRLKNSLNPDAINAETLAAGLSGLSVDKRVELIHDGCDIRKAYSKSLPNLAKVRSLDGDIINGYNTFNSLVINDLDKNVHLLNSTPYSTSDPHYNVIAGVGFTHDDIVLGQISRCDQALKAKFDDLQVRHLLDRGHDDQAVFEHIDNLNSTFVVRLKANRNSNESIIDQQGKEKKVKLVDAQLEVNYEQSLLKFVWKNKLYPQAQISIKQGQLKLDNKTYQVLKIQVYDRTKKPIFKDYMLLITNELCPNFGHCFEIYQAYLRRSKIEGVFKFLKDNLGWETFRVRDFLVIQNLISLCFFVAGYFYEHQKEMANDHSDGLNVKFICSLAKSKGKISKHYYLQGLKIMANYLLFQEAVKEQGFSQETVNELLKQVT